MELNWFSSIALCDSFPNPNVSLVKTSNVNEIVRIKDTT